MPSTFPFPHSPILPRADADDLCALLRVPVHGAHLLREDPAHHPPIPKVWRRSGRPPTSAPATTINSRQQQHGDGGAAAEEVGPDRLHLSQAVRQRKFLYKMPINIFI